MPTGHYPRKPLAEATKIKIGLANSIALKGRKLSEEHKRRVVLAATGRKHPPRSKTWKDKQRQSKLGKKTRPCSEITKKKIREAMLKIGHVPPRYKGKDCHFWKGGITPVNEAVRKSLEYRKWRKSVFERDGYSCVWGKEHGNKLRADHIKPFALYPALRFEITNGRTLCEDCHKKTDTFGGKTKS